MQVKLADETTLDVIQINGARRHYQGANRDTLEIVFDKSSNDLSTLDTTFSDESKLTAITIISTDGAENLYNDYVIKIGVRTEKVVINEGDSNTPDETAERIFVTVAQQTYVEKLLAQLLGQ